MTIPYAGVLEPLEVRPHLATLIADMHRLGPQAATVEHRGVPRLAASYAAVARVFPEGRRSFRDVIIEAVSPCLECKT